MNTVNKPMWIVVHHLGGTTNPLADTSNQKFADVNAWHRDAKDLDGGYKYHYGLPSSLGYYLAYQYMIEKSGVVKQARADTEVGYHTIGYNDKSLGIVLAGNFDVTVPTWEQRLALKSLLERKIAQYGILLQNVVPHRFASPKSCYGRKLADNWARELIKESVDQRITLLTQLLNLYQSLLTKLRSSKIVVGGNDKECDGFIN